MNRLPTWPSWMLLLMLSIMLCARTSRAGFERTCGRDRQMQPNRGMCGPDLSMILSTVCRMYNKRGSPSDAHSTSVTRSEESSKYVNPDIFLPKHEALSVFKRSRRATGTITCECCVHMCKIQELRQYCSEVRSDDEPLKRNSQPAPTTEEPFVTTDAMEDDLKNGDHNNTDHDIHDTDHNDTEHEKKLEKDTLKTPTKIDEKFDKELLEEFHRAQKRRIGQVMLASAPSWWQSLNQMAIRFENAQKGRDGAGGSQRPGVDQGP